MFSFFKKGLSKTSEAFREIIPEKQAEIDKELLEEALVEADMGYELVEEILDPLPSKVVKGRLYNELIRQFPEFKKPPEVQKPFIDLIIGVNGAGKTTTIAKLATKYKNENQKVLLAAGDTFRAAAIEQLKSWAEKIDVAIVFTKHGHDSSAVAYDAIESAKAKDLDRVIIDTAGRLHNQVNLANELDKIIRICGKAKAGSPDRKLLILDGTQGTMAIEQAKIFNERVKVDGVVITKLDGTAKGGAVFAVAKELNLPILFIGVGEKAEDLVEFKADEFVDSFVDSIYGD